ncbi:MAG: serine/threonine protein kinase [Planctomycetes bacterium]|nr:serine/threonine protein kinase [Planctomycetota bacterium]
MGLRVGDVLGSCRLIAALGSGGMGEVFLAQDAHTGRRYALKMLTALDPESVQRFQREAEAQAAADAHPNVLRVISHHLSAQGAYLLLEFASGGDLKARVKQAHLSVEEGVQVVRGVALGLQHVHDVGVLHRDLKPENVLFDEDGVPKLGDFGLARTQSAESLTASGEVLGTPAYMAPEQANGERHNLSPRTDIYALGGLLHFCLTGRPPHSGGSLIATLREILEDPPPRPSDTTPGVPRDLDAICLRCLAKDPADRYPSAAAVVEDLDRFLSGERVEARRRGALLTGLAVALTLAAGGGYALWPDARVEPSPTLASAASPRRTPTRSVAPPRATPKSTRLEKPPLPHLNWKHLRGVSALGEEESAKIDAKLDPESNWFELGKRLERKFDAKGAAYCYARTEGSQEEAKALARWGVMLCGGKSGLERDEARPLGFLLTHYAAIRGAKKARRYLGDIVYKKSGWQDLCEPNKLVAAAWTFLGADPEEREIFRPRLEKGDVRFPGDETEAWDWVANGGPADGR